MKKLVLLSLILTLALPNIFAVTKDKPDFKKAYEAIERIREHLRKDSDRYIPRDPREPSYYGPHKAGDLKML